MLEDTDVSVIFREDDGIDTPMGSRDGWLEEELGIT